MTMPYKDPEALRENKRRYYLANKEAIKARVAAWRAANPDKVAVHERRANQSDSRQKAKRAWAERSAKAHREANREKYNAYMQKRRARVRQALWDRDFTEFVVTEAYRLAAARRRATGIAWELDHTIPLFGRKVSGLHVWSNLQLLPASLNRRKSNQFSPQPQPQ